MINWDDLTPEQKRIEIAKDVIDAITTHAYKPKTGIYVSDELTLALERNKSLQEALVNKQIEDCKVCAIGACFLTYIKFTNNFNVGELLHTDGNKMRFILSSVFSEQQLGLIESAFEFSISYAQQTSDYYEAEKAANWYTKIDRDAWMYSFDTWRLTGIMQNIIDNNGTFIP